MNARLRPRRRQARVLVSAGAVGLALILGAAGLSPLPAQPPSPPAKQADRKAPPSADQNPVAALRLQKLKTRRARADYEIARLNREIAEIAVEEYAEATYNQHLATVEGELKLAESDLIRAQDRSEWAGRMFDKGFVSKATRVSEQLNLEKARYALEQVQARRKVLVDYTRSRTIKSLEAEVEKARKEELTRREVWERAVIRQADLERQLGRT